MVLLRSLFLVVGVDDDVEVLVVVDEEEEEDVVDDCERLLLPIPVIPQSCFVGWCFDEAVEVVVLALCAFFFNTTLPGPLSAEEEEFDDLPKKKPNGLRENRCAAFLDLLLFV